MKTMFFFLVAPFLVLIAWLSTAFGFAATLGASVCVFSFSLPISLFLIGFWWTFGPHKKGNTPFHKDFYHPTSQKRPTDLDTKDFLIF